MANTIVADKFEKQMFSLFMKKADSMYDLFVQDLMKEIEIDQALGIPIKQTVARLQAQYETGTGVYKNYSGQIQKELSNALAITFQKESNDFGEEDKNALYVWQLEPEAKHCDSCLYQASRGELSINEFPIPTMQPLNGETNCERYCKCTLVKVS
jgi:hypothetical protein